MLSENHSNKCLCPDCKCETTDQCLHSNNGDGCGCKTCLHEREGGIFTDHDVRFIGDAIMTCRGNPTIECGGQVIGHVTEINGQPLKSLSKFKMKCNCCSNGESVYFTRIDGTANMYKCLSCGHTISLEGE